MLKSFPNEMPRPFGHEWYSKELEILSNSENNSILIKPPRILSNLGRVNTLELNQETKIVTKSNFNNPEIIETEYNNLLFLKSLGIQVPNIINFRHNKIDLEFIEQTDNNSTSPLDYLPFLHSNKNDKFGWERSMYIGKLEIPSYFTSSWIECFQIRFRKLQDFLVKNNYINYETFYNLEKINDILHLILPDSLEIEPSLLHGDANPNNFIIRNNQVFIIDPCCFYGDPLYDIISYNYWKNRKKPNELSDRELLYYVFIAMSVLGIDNSINNKKTMKKYIDELLKRFPLVYPSNLLNITLPSYFDKIVIQCGSYNPIHKNHIENLYKAKNYLEKTFGISNNILFIFSLASQKRISNKCNNGLDYNTRFNLLKNLLENNWEIADKLKNIKIDISGLYQEQLMYYLNNIFPSIPIYICCGSDNIEYYSNFLNYPIKPEKIICIQRNNFKTNIKNEKIIIIDQYEVTRSSTSIRDKQYNDPNSLFPETINYFYNLPEN